MPWTEPVSVSVEVFWRRPARRFEEPLEAVLTQKPDEVDGPVRRIGGAERLERWAGGQSLGLLGLAEPAPDAIGGFFAHVPVGRVGRPKGIEVGRVIPLRALSPDGEVGCAGIRQHTFRCVFFLVYDIWKMLWQNASIARG